MDSFSKGVNTDPKGKKQHHQPSNSELFSSAKLVADAAKASLNHESDKVDKGKVAGAAEDLLSAASRYGKLEEKGYGKYVDKAENYLHGYHSSHSSTTTTTTTDDSGNTTTTATATHTETHSSGGKEHGKSGSGGYGDYFKMAEGFLKK